MIFMAACSQNNLLFTETKMSAGLCWHLSTLQNLFRKRNLHTKSDTKFWGDDDVPPVVPVAVQSAWFAAQKAWCEGGLNQPFFSKTEERKDKSSSPTILQGQVFFQKEQDLYFLPGTWWILDSLRETWCKNLPIENLNLSKGAALRNRSVAFDLIWVFPKIVGFPPKSSILIGFSIIFTIHFGGITI